MKTLEITTPFHKQKVRKSQSTKKTPKKLTCTHTYTLIHKDGDIKLYIQKRERYIHAYTTQETHKIHKHIQKHTQRDKEKQSKKTQETRNTQKPIRETRKPRQTPFHHSPRKPQKQSKKQKKKHARAHTHTHYTQKNETEKETEGMFVLYRGSDGRS